MYSYKGNYPTDSLPFRILLSDGRTRTDTSTFTEEEILDAGYTLVDDKPIIDENTQRLNWNKDTTSWVIENIPEQEILDAQQSSLVNKWNEIRKERDTKIKEVEWRVQRYESYVRQGLEPIDDIVELDRYIQALRDITNVEDISMVEWPILTIDESNDNNI